MRDGSALLTGPWINSPPEADGAGRREQSKEGVAQGADVHILLNVPVERFQNLYGYAAQYIGLLNRIERLFIRQRKIRVHPEPLWIKTEFS